MEKLTYYEIVRSPKLREALSFHEIIFGKIKKLNSKNPKYYYGQFIDNHLYAAFEKDEIAFSVK